MVVELDGLLLELDIELLLEEFEVELLELELRLELDELVIEELLLAAVDEELVDVGFVSPPPQPADSSVAKPKTNKNECFMFAMVLTLIV